MYCLTIIEGWRGGVKPLSSSGGVGMTLLEKRDFCATVMRAGHGKNGTNCYRFVDVKGVSLKRTVAGASALGGEELGHDGERALDMVADEFAGEVGIAGEGGIEDGFVFGVHITRDDAVDQREAAVTFGLLE